MTNKSKSLKSAKINSLLARPSAVVLSFTKTLKRGPEFVTGYQETAASCALFGSIWVQLQDCPLKLHPRQAPLDQRFQEIVILFLATNKTDMGVGKLNCLAAHGRVCGVRCGFSRNRKMSVWRPDENMPANVHKTDKSTNWQILRLQIFFFCFALMDLWSHIACIDLLFPFN